MIKTSVLTGAAASAIALAALCGSGIASADEKYDGQTYAEANQAVSEAGMTSKIGSVTGDDLPTEQCTVTGSHTMSVVGSSGATGASEVVLNLNCNKTAGTTGQEGESAQQDSQTAAGAQESAEESQLG